MKVLLERDGRLFVDKPAGLPSTGRDLEDPDCAQFLLEQKLGKRVWAVHQLDRGTSGVLLFVTRKSLVADCQQALSRGQKTYLALVHGALERERFEIDAPMRYVKKRGRPAVVPDGKDARTEIVLRERREQASLVEARPRTGRTHQIRVHLAHVDHPILGDVLHGRAEQTRLGLHCWRIRLGNDVAEAPIPEDFRALAERFGLKMSP